MWRNITLSIIAGIFAALLVCSLNPQPRIAVVNITGILNQFVKMETQKKQSTDQMKERAKTFGSELEKTLKSISKKERLILFPSEAVVDGAVDITERVQKQLQLTAR